MLILVSACCCVCACCLNIISEVLSCLGMVFIYVYDMEKNPGGEEVEGRGEGSDALLHT